MEKDNLKSVEEKYDKKIEEIIQDAENKVESKNKKVKANKKGFKSKFKELADINTEDAFEISFKINSKIRKRLVTIFILVFLIIGSFWIKYTSKNSLRGNNETSEEVNQLLHMNDLLKYPDYDDILNNKKIFKNRLIYAEAIVKNQEKESENCLKLEVSLSATENKTAYLYYICEDKDIILKEHMIKFIGKINLINSNKKYIEIDAIRIDTGNGLFTEEDYQKIASLYTQNESAIVRDDTRNVNNSKYGEGEKNYVFDITKSHDSNFPNELRIIDSVLQSDIIDSTSIKGKIYSRIDINEKQDRYIKLKKDFEKNTFSIEFYDLNYNKVFDKSWKNIHTNDRFAYDYVSNDGKFYINIENAIYVFDEKTGEEVKIDVTGKGYIDVDFKGNIYYLSIDDNGYVASFNNKGEILWKEPLISPNKYNKYEIKGINEIVVVDNTNVLVQFEVSKIHNDRKDPETFEFALLKSNSGIKLYDTLD